MVLYSAFFVSSRLIIILINQIYFFETKNIFSEFIPFGKSPDIFSDNTWKQMFHNPRFLKLKEKFLKNFFYDITARPGTVTFVFIVWGLNIVSF